MIRSTFALALAALASSFAFACASTPNDRSSDDSAAEGALTRRVDAAWFYDGPLVALTDANVTVSLKGNTARINGYLPVGTEIADLPHVKGQQEGDRLHVDIVYPIATARAGKSNSGPGVYNFQSVKPYRPDGTAYTAEEGEHWVPWGGYPFVAYNGGIAFHGPITYTEPAATPEPEDDIWYLARGPVSGGCNRMAAEHIVEFTHAIGVSMRKIYTANKAYPPNTPTTVTVIDDYDMVGGKYVDVDYPTFGSAVRPGKVYGTNNVVMFGSWAATETPDGSDLPPNLQWEGGVRGKYYVFAEHTREGMVCSVEKRDLAALKTFASHYANAELPQGFCAKRDCIVSALRSAHNPKSSCNL